MVANHDNVQHIDHPIVVHILTNPPQLTNLSPVIAYLDNIQHVDMAVHNDIPGSIDCSGDGGGIIKDGKKVAWTFAGTVGFLDDGQTTIVGQYQLVDHANKVSWHCHNEFTYLHFKGTSASSPPAMYNIGTFTGNFTNKNRDWQVITIQITDKRESGKKGDTIKAKEGSFTDIDAAFASPWLFQADPIRGGNLQVHNGYK